MSPYSICYNAISPSTFLDSKIYIYFYFGYPDLSLTSQTRFCNLTILNTHKQRTDKLCLIAVTNELLTIIANAALAPSGNVRVSLNRCVCWVSPLSGAYHNFKCRRNNYKFIIPLAVLDAFIAISEDLNVKFSRGSMPPDLPSLFTLTRSY